MKLKLTIIVAEFALSFMFFALVATGSIPVYQLIPGFLWAAGGVFFSVVLWKERKWNSEIRKSSGTSPPLSSNPLSQSATFQTASQQLYQRMSRLGQEQRKAVALQMFYGNAYPGLTSTSPEPQPKPRVKQEIAAAPIVGWRLWNIQVDTEGIEQPRTHAVSMSVSMSPGAAWVSNTANPSYGVALQPTLPKLLLALADKVENGQDIAQAIRAMVKVRLLSANSEPWEKGRAARCGIHGQSISDHIQPDPQCTCGYWALRSRDAVHRRFGFPGAPTYATAVGTVELWGKVIEHEHGWRAEYARPKEITVYNSEQWVADAIAREWECEVTRA